MVSTLPKHQHHADLEDMDGDLIIEADDGLRFCSHKLLFQLASPVFRNSLHGEILHLPEKSHTIANLLRMISLQPLSTMSFEDMISLLDLAQRYQMNGLIAILRVGMSLKPQSGEEALQMYRFACRSGWKAEAQAASTKTLSLDLGDVQYTPCLALLDTPDLLSLLQLHRARRNGLAQILADETRFPSVFSFRCPEHSVPTEMRKVFWESFSAYILQQFTNRPDGEHIKKMDLTNHPFLEILQSARCFKADCSNHQQTDFFPALINILVKVIDELPTVADVDINLAHRQEMQREPDYAISLPKYSFEAHAQSPSFPDPPPVPIEGHPISPEGTNTPFPGFMIGVGVVDVSIPQVPSEPSISEPVAQESHMKAVEPQSETETIREEHIVVGPCPETSGQSIPPAPLPERFGRPYTSLGPFPLKPIILPPAPTNLKKKRLTKWKLTKTEEMLALQAAEKAGWEAARAALQRKCLGGPASSDLGPFPRESIIVLPPPDARKAKGLAKWKKQRTQEILPLQAAKEVGWNTARAAMQQEPSGLSPATLGAFPRKPITVPPFPPNIKAEEARRQWSQMKTEETIALQAAEEAGWNAARAAQQDFLSSTSLGSFPREPILLPPPPPNVRQQKALDKWRNQWTKEMRRLQAAKEVGWNAAKAAWNGSSEQHKWASQGARSRDRETSFSEVTQ